MDRQQKRVLRLRNHVLSKSKAIESDTKNDSEGSDAIAYDDITKPEIMKELDLIEGIEYDPKDKKEILYELLIKEG